jgi:dienelactone hydrolase
VVWIHGGALIDPDLNKDYDIVRWGVARTVQSGFVSVSVDYRLTIEAPLPACIQDCQTAIRFLKAHAARFNIDPDRMAVAGESAGGYLAGLCSFAADANAFTTGDWNQVSSKVACGVLWYPAITHPPYNVDEYIAPKSIPVLSIHIEKVCKAKKNPFQLVTLKSADHGFFPDLSNPDADFDGYRKNMEQANELTVEFLKKQLK